MKKEWFAIALLICVVLGSVLNLRSLQAFTQTLDAQIEKAVIEADAENWTAAESLTEEAMREVQEVFKLPKKRPCKIHKSLL